MNCIIRELKKEEYALLRDFLYEAIFIPEGTEAPPRDILDLPELQIYYQDFGKPDDICYLAELDGKAVGAAWTRIMNDYGHVAEGTPSWAIAVLPQFRGHGIGTRLMQAVIEELRARGYRQTSLSVQIENRAWHLYQRLGFKVIGQKEQEYLMLKKL